VVELQNQDGDHHRHAHDHHGAGKVLSWERTTAQQSHQERKTINTPINTSIDMQDRMTHERSALLRGSTTAGGRWEEVPHGTTHCTHQTRRVNMSTPIKGKCAKGFIDMAELPYAIGPPSRLRRERLVTKSSRCLVIPNVPKALSSE